MQKYALLFLETPMHSVPPFLFCGLSLLACLLAYLLFYEKVFHCSSLPLNSEDVVLHFNKEKGMKFECHSYL